MLNFPTSLKSLKLQTRHHIVLAILLIIYIFVNIPIPNSIASLVDTSVGKIVIAMIVVAIFHVNPVIGILSFVAAYQLISRSGVSTGSFAINNYLPSESSKAIEFSNYNNFPTTLEEEMVKKMAPMVIDDNNLNLDYKPVLDGLHDAAPIDYEGVV
jgi:hypothetical protein